MKRKILNSTYLPIILSLVLIIGVLIGFSLQNEKPKSVNYRSGEKLVSLISLISQKYVEKIDEEQLIDKSIESVIRELDPHSSYIKPKKLKVLEEELSGHFYGIGVQFRLFRDSVLVIMPVENGPSEKVGIIAGDRIIEANGIALTGDSIRNEKVMEILKGELNTDVNVKVKRPYQDQILSFTIKRGNIPTFSIESSFMHNNKIGYINLTKFSATTYDEVFSAISGLKKQGLKDLIIDLRYNGGGYLSAATSVADEFLKEGNIIVYTDGENQEKIVSKSTNRTHFGDLNLIILINEYSASASEILAGAIQDNDRGLIIGRRSFGKGLVQEQFKLPDNSAIRLTVAKYYTPTGRSIQKPYKSNNNSDYYHDIIDRYENGEMENKDSIKYVDSLKFITKGGKTVYGGGGITPDIFIAVDTNQYYYFLNALVANSLMLDFSFEITDKSKNEFDKFKNLDEFMNGFTKANFIEDFKRFIEKSDVEFDSKAFSNLESEIANRIKAYVARNLYGSQAYYRIILSSDKAYIEAIKTFESDTL